MAGKFHEHLRRGRRKLHDFMGRPALCFMPPFVDGETEPKPITVRVHDNNRLIGDLKGTNFNYAEFQDDSPRIVFMRSQVHPASKLFVTLRDDTGNGIGYRVTSVERPNDITVTAVVAALEDDDMVGLPLPPVTE